MTLTTAGTDLGFMKFPFGSRELKTSLPYCGVLRKISFRFPSQFSRDSLSIEVSKALTYSPSHFFSLFLLRVHSAG